MVKRMWPRSEAPSWLVFSTGGLCQTRAVRLTRVLTRVHSLPGAHVTNTAGTGLVHTAPAHGQDDFRVGLQFSLEGNCAVGEDGRFLPEAGGEFQGLNIFRKGVQRVMEMLGEDVMYSEAIIHSYPYDWRTKKPVFLRASKQWFINTDKLKTRAMSVLEGVEIQPESAGNGFRGVVDRRPYWCISRQRVWGTFIPVIYNKVSHQSYQIQRRDK